MPVSPRTAMLTCALLCCGAVSSETLIPLNGQSQQQIQNDIAACQSQAAELRHVLLGHRRRAPAWRRRGRGGRSSGRRSA